MGTSLDTGAVYDGYFCDFDRNFMLGPAAADVRRGDRTLYRAVEAGLAAARPGATCSDLFHAMSAVIEDAGYDRGTAGRLEHGLGMQLTEWPSHAPDNRTTLMPGMVLTLEPAPWVGPGRGLVHEENIVIRDDGAQLLTRRAAEEMAQIS